MQVPDLSEKSMNLQNDKVKSTSVPLKMLEKLTKLRNIAGKSICNLKIESKDLGTGAIYQVENEKAKQSFIFITCNHLLPTTSRKELSHATLQFDDIQQMKSINLDKKHIKFVWTTKLFDATVIEISHELATSFESYGAHFLKLGDAVLNEGSRKVAILKYTFGKLHIEQGEIKELSETDVIYRMGTSPGSSGSPVLTLDCLALAVHSDVASGVMFYQPASVHKATSLRNIVKAFLEEKTQNNQELIILKHQLTTLKSEISKLEEEKRQAMNSNFMLESELTAHRKEEKSHKTTEANIEVEDSHRTDKGLLNKPITPNQRKQSKSVCEVHLVHLASSQKSPQTRDHSDSEASAAPIAASDVPHLKLLKRISQRNMKHSNIESLHVWGLCALTDDMAMLASGLAGLRTFSHRTGQLSPRDPCDLKNVYSVTFDAPTDTLLLAVWIEGATGGVYWLVSLRRGPEEWLEVMRIQSEIKHLDFGPWYVSLSAVCASRVLLGEHDTERLAVFDVNEKHCLHPVGTVLLENQFRVFACTREGPDTLVALSHDDNSVSLHRLVALRLEPLARVKLTDPWDLLFRGHMLLVSDYKDIRKQAIVSMDTRGGHLMHQRQLLEANAKIRVEQWCLSDDHLLIIDYNSKDLLVYSIE